MGWPTYVAIAGTTLALSFTDLIQRRLPNRLVLLFTVAALGLVLLGDHHPETSDRWPALLAAVIAGLVGYAAYRAGLIAAGDIKIIPALIALEVWMGSTAQLIYLGCLLLAGTIALTWSLWLSRPTGSAEPAASIPFGTVLLVGVAPSASAIGPINLF